MRAFFKRAAVGEFAQAGKGERLLLPGDPPISIELRPSKATRRLSLKVSRLDGRVTLSMPHGARTVEAEQFAREKETWIRKQVSSQPAAVVPKAGGLFMLEGREMQVVGIRKGPVRVEGARLFVPGDESQVPARLQAFLMVMARERLVAACGTYSAALGVSYNRISLRDTRSRWGSCTSEGNLMFSWRLVMAPPDVLDYVAAHEVAHLLEMNHSAAYWKNVADVCPDYQVPRAWLRQNAALLHSFQFRN